MTELPRYMLPPDGTPVLPAGLRASSWASCPAKCVIEFYDPARYYSFDVGVGQAGHDLADLFIDRVLQPACPVPVIREMVLPWADGRASSHIDCVVPEGEYAGPWELKSTYANPRYEPVTPSSTNRKQVRIMSYLAEQAGIELPGPFRLALIAKKDWSLHGPWTVDYTPDDRAQLALEHAQILAWWDDDTLDLRADSDLQAACTCGVCFTPERSWLEEASYLVDMQWHTIIHTPCQHAEWKQQEKTVLKKIRVDVAEMMKAAGHTHAETWFYNLTLDKRGTLRITQKKDLAA